MTSFTVKEIYIPFRPMGTTRIKVDPFTIGIYFNYTLGKQFFLVASAKQQYPERYYDYSSALRTGLFVGGRIQRKTKCVGLDRIGFYYELGTYDLAVHNYIFNINKSGYRFNELFSLALGIKFFLKN